VGPQEPTSDEETLALRLRVDALERDLEAAQGALARRLSEFDALSHQRWWRVAERAGSARRALRPDSLVARGHSGAGLGGVRLPLTGVRTVGPAPIAWHDALTVDGVTLGGLLADPPQVLGYRLTAVPDGAAVRAFAALRPGAWTANRGGVRFRIALVGAGDVTLAAVEEDIDPGIRREHRRWVPITLTLPRLGRGEVAELQLATVLPPGADPGWAWAAWGDPVLLLPGTGPADVLPQGAAAAKAAVGLGRASARRRRRRSSPPPPGHDAPSLSLLMPVHDPAPELLRAALDAVRAQDDPRWQLCLADDGSADPAVTEMLEQAAAADPRMTLVRNAAAGGISAATNLALGVARGEYVATLDHDDLLTPDAVGTVRALLGADATIDVLYSDNDKVGAGGVRFAPALKPDWSPALLRAVMYTLHLGVYRRALVERIGGWRTAFDGAQDHDLVLRLSEVTGRIAHVPRTLYSWRAHAGSAALAADAKAHAYDRGAAAIDEHLRRLGLPAHAERLPDAGRYRVVHDAPPSGTVSVVIPVPADVAGREAAVRDVIAGFRAATLEGLDLVLVGPGLPGDLGPGVRTVAADGHWGALATAGVGHAGGATIVVLEELCFPAGAGWEGELAGPLREPDTVASSPLVRDARGHVAHAGVALVGGVPLPVHPGADLAAEDLPTELTVATNRASAGGVVAVRRETLTGSPLDPAAERLGLTSLTASLTAAGGRVVCSPHAPWQVVGEVRAQVIDLAELTRFHRVHADREDPFYNPRFWPDRASHLVPRALWSTGHLSEIDRV
jgi:hypothetical protein